MKTILCVFSVVGLLLVLDSAPSEGLPRYGRSTTAVTWGRPITWGTMEGVPPSWSSSGEVQVAYYNFCTGWHHGWSDWDDGDRLGVVFDSYCQPGETATLVDSRIYCGVVACPPGYGFTGTVGVYDVDADLCPVDPPLFSQTWLPAAGQNEFTWNTPVGERFAVVATLADDPGDPWENPTLFVTDCSQGPTGPPACGTCYPTTRVSRSYVWSASGIPYCPGWRFTDYTCDVELAFDVGLNCAVGVSARTWGRIKALYR
jgi:hypothetical protein